MNNITMTKVGDEFRVNTYTQNEQAGASTASLSDGSFVTVWASKAKVNSAWSVWGKKYNIDGGLNTDEFIINTTTTVNHMLSTHPYTFHQIIPLSNGGFVVVFEEQISGKYTDYSGGGQWRVKARAFDNKNVGGDEITLSRFTQSITFFSKS